MLREVVRHAPEEVLVHIAKAVTLARQQEHIEALVSTDKSVYNTQGTTWVNVLVDIAVNEEEVTLEALCEFVVSRDVVLEDGLAILLNLADTVVLLAPPTVVDVVIVVTGARYRNIEEVGVHQYCGSRHEATT